jgi:hypothetical protein
MKARKIKNGSPLDRLIERSVDQALTVWLSGQAIRATEELSRELWNDEDFRRDFLASARAAAREALERLRRHEDKS